MGAAGVATVTVKDVDIADLDYELPTALVAQHPPARRGDSRLLVYDRASGDVRHRRFAELPDELHGELVVVNDTRVVPARIPINSPRGEVLLLERLDGDVWEGLARPTRRLEPGRRYGPVELLEHLGEGRWRLRLDGEPHGDTPLPPYITARLDDPERYQTVYARDPGSAAAPTAGLHFTPELLELLDVERVTLHVGLDTFRPVTEERLEDHRIHGERYEVAPATWERIRAAERVLEQAYVAIRRAKEHRHLVEPDAARRFLQDAPRDLDALASFAGRRIEDDVAGGIAFGRLPIGEEISPQGREIGVVLLLEHLGLQPQRLEPRERGDVAERNGDQGSGNWTLETGS